MDCHQDDPIGGIPGVDAALLGWRDRLVIGEVVRRGIPLVLNLAGGYQSVGTTVALHVATIRVAAEAFRDGPCLPSLPTVARPGSASAETGLA
jgi:hypothetical protein